MRCRRFCRVFPWRCSCYAECPLAGVRAMTQALTVVAPAWRTTAASSCSVAPVVMTSSTSATRIPFRGVAQANAPRRFFLRARRGRDACGTVSRVRVHALARNGIFSWRAMIFPISTAWLKPRSRSRAGWSGMGTMMSGNVVCRAQCVKGWVSAAAICSAPPYLKACSNASMGNV